MFSYLDVDVCNLSIRRPGNPLINWIHHDLEEKVNLNSEIILHGDS